MQSLLQRIKGRPGMLNEVHQGQIFSQEAGSCKCANKSLDQPAPQDHPRGIEEDSQAELHASTLWLWAQGQSYCFLFKISLTNAKICPRIGLHAPIKNNHQSQRSLYLLALFRKLPAVVLGPIEQLKIFLYRFRVGVTFSWSVLSVMQDRKGPSLLES